MNGNVSQRAAGEWEYRFDIDPDPMTGKRRRRTKSGFRTRKAAATAMREDISAHERGRSVSKTRRTVADFLLEWHPAVRAGLRPTTWVNYGDYMRAYVLPVIGDTRLQDLTPMRLNLLYGHLLTNGRVRRPGGLAPKTVQNVHRLLHRALSDAVKWDMLSRNVAEDAQAPRVGRVKHKIWTPEQLAAFVTHVRDDRFFALWLLVVTTGIRRGDWLGCFAATSTWSSAGSAPARPGWWWPVTPRSPRTRPRQASEPWPWTLTPGLRSGST